MRERKRENERERERERSYGTADFQTRSIFKCSALVSSPVFAFRFVEAVIPIGAAVCVPSNFAFRRRCTALRCHVWTRQSTYFVGSSGDPRRERDPESDGYDKVDTRRRGTEWLVFRPNDREKFFSLSTRSVISYNTAGNAGNVKSVLPANANDEIFAYPHPGFQLAPFAWKETSTHRSGFEKALKILANQAGKFLSDFESSKVVIFWIPITRTFKPS